MNFTFPPTKFVQENTEDEQLAHVCSEFIEMIQAKDLVDQHREAADLYGALETYFRLLERVHGPEYVRDAIFGWVEQKNRRRAYYLE